MPWASGGPAPVAALSSCPSHPVTHSWGPPVAKAAPPGAKQPQIPSLPFGERSNPPFRLPFPDEAILMLSRLALSISSSLKQKDNRTALGGVLSSEKDLP